jgi:hypothetical protein
VTVSSMKRREEEVVVEEEEIDSMLNIRTSRTPIEGSPVPGCLEEEEEEEEEEIAENPPFLRVPPAHHVDRHIGGLY